MNLLALGEEEAKNLGVDVPQVRWRLFLCISLLTGGALAAVGVIAFFGLIMPHILRRLHGPDHMTLIPLCMVAGPAVFAALDLSLRAIPFQSVISRPLWVAFSFYFSFFIRSSSALKWGD